MPPHQQHPAFHHGPDAIPSAPTHSTTDFTVASTFKACAVQEQGFGRKGQCRSMSLEHGFLRSPSPGLSARPAGLFFGGHHPVRDTLQSRVVHGGQVDASGGLARRRNGYRRPHLVVHGAVGDAQSSGCLLALEMQPWLAVGIV